MLQLNFSTEDHHSQEIIEAAVQAVLSARKDGQESGKHSPESWQEETIPNQLVHAREHLDEMLSSRWNDSVPEYNNLPSLIDMQHAICRLAIGIALFVREHDATT